MLISIIKSLKDKFRIFFLLNFRRDLVKKSLLLRKEKNVLEDYCIKCQECCKGCPALSEKGCKIWKDADWRCRTFPIFEFQLKRMIQKKPKVESKCKYYWEEKNIKNKK